MPRPRLERPNYRLRQRGGTWVVDWTESGKPRSLSTRQTDERLARQWLAQFVAGREAPQAPPQPTIAEIMDGYLADRAGHVSALDRLKFAGHAIRHHVGDLRSEHLQRRTYWERRQRDHVAPATILREGATLRAALKWAERENWIVKAPYIALPPKSPPRERFLSRAEADLLLSAAVAPHVRLFIRMALHTGARRGAILDLTWDRVDFDRRLIAFHRPGRAQSKKRRATVPINDTLIGPLQEARMAATTEWVIEYRGRKAGNIRHAFERAVERAGIAYCTRHDLRRTAASWMVMAGVPLKKVAAMLGDTEEMIERVYGRWAPDYLDEAARALAGPVSLTNVKSIAASGSTKPVKTANQLPRTKGVRR